MMPSWPKGWPSKALIDIEKENWARKMQQLLRRACHAANLARERGSPLQPRLIARMERRYDAILAEGLAFQGPDRHREGKLGAQDATAAAPRLSRRQPRTRARQPSQAPPDRTDGAPL